MPIQTMVSVFNIDCFNTSMLPIIIEFEVFICLLVINIASVLSQLMSIVLNEHHSVSLLIEVLKFINRSKRFCEVVATLIVGKSTSFSLSLHFHYQNI